METKPERHICKVNYKNVFNNIAHLFLAYTDENMEWKTYNAYTNNPAYMNFIKKLNKGDYVNVALGKPKNLVISDKKNKYNNKMIITSIRRQEWTK